MSTPLETLRTRIRQLEASPTRSFAVLPFGVIPLDQALSGGGLALGALHEVATDLGDSAPASLFAAGIVARVGGAVLWCLPRADLFAPALAQAGLAADRVIHLEAGNDASLLACCEEGLRHGGVSVVAEIGKFPMIASRRLQLAAERAGKPMLVLRRVRNPADLLQPTAAVTRWRITALPSAPLQVAGVGTARWRVELLRARGGRTADLVMDACDAQGYLALPAVLADRSAGAADRIAG